MEKDTPKSLVALSSFYEFTRLCERIGDEASYTQKVEVVKAHLKPLLAPGSKKKLSEEEQAATATVVQLTCGLLLCKDDRKRVYNLRDRNMAKLMARHWKCPVEDVLQDIAEGDVSETAKRFFVSHGKPCSRSTFTLQMVEGFLNKLANLTKEDDQYQVLASIIDKSTADDLKWIIRIIDKDLRIKIGPKFVLGALHPDAFEAYRNSADLKEIVNKVLKHESLQDLSASQILAEEETGVKPKGKGKIFNTSVTLMSPVKPMIASPIKSIDGCMKKCPRGMFAEIKYDGERIQIHKKGDEYAFYSRNLKKILEWKVAAVRDYITESTEAETIILDGEILLMDTKTSKPLPFGSLAIHKKNDFQDATVCLFLFDILYVDGKVVMNEPLKKRRQILEESVTSIPHRIEFSEYKEISDLTTGEEALTEMMDRVLKEGLEGLMIKDIGDVYKPDKRHWLKLKKDYLAGMADSADLVVLGAYFGTGAYGGMMSVFLMGSYDPDEEKWKARRRNAFMSPRFTSFAHLLCFTVCKAGNGFDDAALKQLQKQLRPHMKQIHKSYDKVPSWLDINRLHVPDFIVTDPEQAPVWEVAGQGFTDSKHHTTLSIRFPRVTRIRDDKDFSTHTDVVHLRALAKASAEAVAKAQGSLAHPGTSMTKAKSAAQKASGIGTLDIKGGGKPVPKAGATSTSSSSSSASAGKPKATTATATITNWMGKSKPKPAPQAKSAAATPEGLTVVKAGAGGGADLRAALVKASVSAPKAAAPADRRTLLVHCVNDAGALSADVEDRLGLLWAQSARDAWTQHAAGGDEQEAPLGEIQMAKLTKKTKKNEGDDDDGVAGKLWLVNAVTHESAKAPQSSSPPGAFSAAAFESAMGMVAAIAKVRKAVVVLALVTRPGGRGPAERAEALRIVARQLLAKKVHVVVYEMAADISDDDGDDGDDDDDDHEQQTVVVKKSTKPAAAVVRGEEEQGSGSDTEDMDDDALEDLLRGKGKGKPLPTGAKPQQQTHNAAKPPAKPPVVVVKKGAAAAPMTTKPVKKEEEDGSGSDTEEMDAMDVVVVAAEKSKAKKANAVVPTREPSDSDSGTEEMDMADLKPPAAKTGAVPNAPKPKATVAGHAAAVAAEEEEEGSGSDTEEMDVEQEKANAAKAKGEIIVDTTTTTKRKRGEAAQKQVATRRKRAKREQEQSEEERRKREERRVGRLLRGVGVVVGDAVDGDAKRELAQQIEAMGGTVSQEWVPYGGRMSTHLVLVAPTAAALSSVAVKHADRLGGKVVRAEWVTDCWREKRRLSERLYYALPKHYLEDDDDDDDDDDDEDDEEEGDVSPADDESEQEEPETTTTAATKKKKKKVIVIPSGPSASTSSSSTSSVAAVTELPSIFTGFSFYFYGHNKKKGNQFPTCDKSELERYAVAYGAEVSELVTEETTHVVSWRRDVDPSVLASGGDVGAIKVVSPHWAWDAINTATRRPEQPYLL